MRLLDTSGPLAAIDESQHAHRDCASALQAAPLADVARGADQLERCGADDVARAARVIERFADLQTGLADPCLVVLAEHHGVSRILILDVKHFSVLRIGERKRLSPVPAAR